MLSSFSRSDRRREALPLASLAMTAANSRRPSCECALPIRFAVSASRSLARPCRRWSTPRASAEAAA